MGSGGMILSQNERIIQSMFYFMYYKYSGRREAILSAVHNEADHDYCPVCGGNFAIPREPVKFEMKGEPCDYYMSCGSIFISKRMHEFMQELGVTGYSVRSAEVIAWDKAKNEENCENLIYYALDVTGRCGFMMDLNGNHLPKCDVCGRRFVLKEKVHGVKFERLITGF